MIRDFDPSGRLICAGLAWTEWRFALLKVTFNGMLFSPMAAALLHFTLSYEVRQFVVPSLISATIWSAWTFFMCSRRSRAIVFFRDGRIEATFGLPFRRAATYMPADHAAIRSIERAARSEFWFVDVYTAAGAIIPVARLAGMNEAHMVVTQLNNALEELRRDMATPDQLRHAANVIN